MPYTCARCDAKLAEPGKIISQRYEKDCNCPSEKCRTCGAQGYFPSGKTCPDCGGITRIHKSYCAIYQPVDVVCKGTMHGNEFLHHKNKEEPKKEEPKAVEAPKPKPAQARSSSTSVPKPKVVSSGSRSSVQVPPARPAAPTTTRQSGETGHHRQEENKNKKKNGKQ